MLISKNHQNSFLELYYYYYYLKNFNKFFFIKINNIFINNFFFFFLKKKNFLTTNFKKNIKNNFFEKTKSLTEIKNGQIIFANKIFFNSKNSFINDKLINLYFLFNYSLFNSNFGNNSTLKMFSIHNYNNKLIIFDSSQFLRR